MMFCYSNRMKEFRSTLNIKLYCDSIFIYFFPSLLLHSYVSLVLILLACTSSTRTSSTRSCSSEESSVKAISLASTSRTTAGAFSFKDSTSSKSLTDGTCERKYCCGGCSDSTSTISTSLSSEVHCANSSYKPPLTSLNVTVTSYKPTNAFCNR